MASAVIHLAIAKQINKKLNLDEKSFLLGAIAPDISKQVGDSKKGSHFLTRAADNIPNIDEFLDKYKHSMNNPFNLGYFVHLYTDRLWFYEYISNMNYNNSLKLLDGTVVTLPEKEILHLIYEDYSNLNIALLDEYGMDLSLFYEEFPIPNSEIDEIPMDKLPILIDKMGIIIKNSSNEKNYIFDIHIIKEFIDYSTDKILGKINELKK